MATDPPGGTYSVHLSGDLAKLIEEEMSERDISQSKAMRDVLLEGKRRREKRSRFFERSAVWMTAISFAAAFSVLISAAVVWVATMVGVSVGVVPGAVLSVGGITTLVLFLTALVGYASHVSGAAAWMDDQAAAIAARLGVGS